MTNIGKAIFSAVGDEGWLTRMSETSCKELLRSPLHLAVTLEIQLDRSNLLARCCHFELPFFELYSALHVQ